MPEPVCEDSTRLCPELITLYCLVMAMFMLIGAKIGDIIGRHRAFLVGLIIYGIGSLMTALAPIVAVLTAGWSIFEGISAALVLPALAALIAGNFAGASRKVPAPGTAASGSRPSAFREEGALRRH